MDIDRIAELARLELSDAERERFAQDLASILEYFERLQALDTTGVPVAVSAMELEPRERDDEPQPSPPVDELLGNAPARNEDLYEVPRVLSAD